MKRSVEILGEGAAQHEANAPAIAQPGAVHKMAQTFSTSDIGSDAKTMVDQI